MYPASSSSASPASGGDSQQGPIQQFDREGVRLDSFKDFPTSVPVAVDQLVLAGFFYTGEGDSVKCFRCAKTHGGWQVGDCPKQIHACISPSCPFVLKDENTNVPHHVPRGRLSLDSGYGSPSPNTTPVESAGSGEQRVENGTAPDTPTSSRGEGSRPESSSSNLFFPQSALLPPTQNPAGVTASADMDNSLHPTPRGARVYAPMNAGNARSLQRPLNFAAAVYPMYAQIGVRRQSFFERMMYQGPMPVGDLTMAGFFCTGYPDSICCFFCGIGPKSWQPGYIPDVVHARWNPECRYLRVLRGNAFVNQIAYYGVSLRTQVQIVHHPLQVALGLRCLSCASRRVYLLHCGHFLCLRCIPQSGQQGGLLRCPECDRQYIIQQNIATFSRFYRWK